MSRNMVDVNQAIFSGLDSHCASQELSLKNAGTPRWIESRAQDRRFIKSAKLIDRVSVGPSRAILRFDLDGSTYFACQGLSQQIEISGVFFLEPEAGQAATLIYEARPRPISDLSIIRQFVEFSDKESDPSYPGHPAQGLLTVFPQLSIGKFPELIPEETWRHFFLISLCEVAGSSWISENLIHTLRAVCDLDPATIPYKTLCRSIFDTDPSALFLALYRCIEALYAYDSAKKVGKALKLDTDWSDIAVVLEDEIGWHPREEGSLEKLLILAEKHDLNGACTSLGATDLPEEHGALARRAAKQIYKTRNALVHYRPSHHKIDISKTDWARVCSYMSGIVLSIYFSVFITKDDLNRSRTINA